MKYDALKLENQCVTVKELGERRYLDSGTLTPLLKRLEAGGHVTRSRSAEDERSLNVALTDKGRKLQDKAAGIPAKMGECLNLSGADASALYRLLYQILREE